MSFDGRRATIMGLGHFGGGTAAARWLAQQGAVVTVTDLAAEHVLAASLAELRGEPIARFHLGGHREEDFRDADLVVVNPAVRPGNPMLEIARRTGARLSSEIELFMEACPAPILGVTGSNGKSTTAAMSAAILQTAGKRAWLGGNIGNSLLGQLDRIADDDWVVLELSSFQLWHLGPHAPASHVAVVTNCSPNHLDWHGTHEAYVAAKRQILMCQTPADMAVLNTLDAEVGAWGRWVRGARLPLMPVEEIPPLLVPGEHNRVNAACAATAAAAVGCSNTDIRRGLESFRGLPERLECCGTAEQRRFYNDTAATTPESTIAALNSLEGRVWLLAGGGDKGCDLSRLGRCVAESAAGGAFFGETGRALRDLVDGHAIGGDFTATRTLDEAFGWCWEHSTPGDAMLLSPACPSGEQFAHYRERGECFVDLVRGLTGRSNR